MRRMWWMWILVFLLGFGAGKGARAMQQPQTGQLPEFSAPATKSTEPSAPEETDKHSDEETGLPCAFRYTSLVARQLVSYDGPSMEDGTEAALEGTAALVLENTGTVGMEYVQVVLTQNGQELRFEATYIPPRAAVLIVESNRTPYSGAPVENCRCRTVIPGSFDWSKGVIRIEERDVGSLAVTNLTDQPISCTRVFYKQHDGYEDLYIGGITYSAVLTDLMPGETRVITPYRYACGYSAVVAVVTE